MKIDQIVEEIERKRKDVNNAALLINGNIIPEGGPK